MSHIEISTAMARETCQVSASGTAVTRHEPSLRVFWLELVEDDARTIVWDGATYPDALAAAAEWAADDDIEVTDRVAATWGRS